jgi:hypothetical protein
MKIQFTALALAFIFAISLSAQQNQDEYFIENFVRNADYVYKPNIRTVLLHKEGFEMSNPVVELHSDERLVLSFDDLSGEYQKFEYTIIHCDADWNYSDLMPNEYLETFTDDFLDMFEYSFNTTMPYVHYSKVIPNDVIQFTLSGNYLLKVYAEGDPDDVVLTRRFFVVEPKVNVTADIRKPLNILDRETRQEVSFTINTGGLSVSEPHREIAVSILQNGRWDNAITDLKPRSVVPGELRYDYDGVNVFDGGNAFRYFDIKSLRYNSFRVAGIDYNPATGHQVFLHDDLPKKKYVFENVQENIMGRFLIKTEDMRNSAIEADYATVHFFLPYDTPLIQGKLYLFGEFTNWQFLPEAEMKYNYDRMGFEGSMLLKQGFYNYQYVLLPNNSTVGDLELIEGNFFTNNNEYTFLIYYKPVSGRYDRLVNVSYFMTFSSE